MVAGGIFLKKHSTVNESLSCFNSIMIERSGDYAQGLFPAGRDHIPLMSVSVSCAGGFETSLEMYI